jgi:aryl-alcohol dehydrogenase-like predicted oxidoreductase
METVHFGNTGLVVSRLSIGTGTHGWAHHSEQTALGLEGLSALLQQAYELGINFWDTADQYGSHEHVAHALKSVPRDRVVIATKTNSHSGRAVARDVERFLRELRTDVLDVVLLHCISDENWPRRQAGAMEALSRAKEEGKVRAVGISCHGLGALRVASQSDWLDAILVRINSAGTRMDGSVDEVKPLIEQLYAAGKAVYGMKVLGCGRLVENARAAIQYVLQLGTVHALTIGASRPEHLRQNARLVEELAPQYPLRVLQTA